MIRKTVTLPEKNYDFIFSGDGINFSDKLRRKLDKLEEIEMYEGIEHTMPLKTALWEDISVFLDVELRKNVEDTVETKNRYIANISSDLYNTDRVLRNKLGDALREI